MALQTVAVIIMILQTTTVAIDPVKGMVRDVAFVARSAWDQIINQIKLPRLVTNEDGFLSFQTDPRPEETKTSCPRCFPASPDLFLGTWHAVLWSRNFHLTTVTDLNSVINKLESGKPIYTQQSFEDLFAGPPEVLCPRLTILNADHLSKFEFMYQVQNGQQKSIIGTWEYLSDGSYFWRAAPTVHARLCVAFATVNNNSADTDFVVFNQLDSWPSCSNFIAFSRSRQPDLVNNLRDFMEQQGLEGVFNRVQKLYCPRVEYAVPVVPENVDAPRPSPDLDPFALPGDLRNVTMDELVRSSRESSNETFPAAGV